MTTVQAWACVAAVSLLLLIPDLAPAHTSEQSFVLLLPTEIYIAGGILAVALTVLILALAPSRLSERVFSTIQLPALPSAHHLKTVTSLLSLVLFASLIAIGYLGPQDPLSNPLPLAIWTIWWMALLVVQGLLGDIWSWINPWTGLCRLLDPGGKGIASTPMRWPGHWIAIAALVAFHLLALADPAPDEPARLADFAVGYWLFAFGGMVLFGRDIWMERCECFTVLFGLFAKVALVRSTRQCFEIGIPGWQLVRSKELPVGIALFSLAALATGSFDGLNETFWWLALIGVNPLEFPGRSAVIFETSAGILLAPVLLVMIFAAATWAGNWLANSSRTPGGAVRFETAFRRLAISVLPIALGYHIAHYLTAFMVNIQYSIAAASDPLHSGADYLGLGTFYVTTGFFNTRDTVRVIWLTQAVAVVIGHVVAVMVAHEIARNIYGSGKRAIVSQLPISVFMILYTLLSLWLLASPRGA